PSIAREELEITNAFLIAGIEIVSPPNAKLVGAANDRLHQFALFRNVRGPERPIAAVRAARATAIVLGALEVGQHALPIPAAISELRPCVIVLALSSDEDQPVDRTRTAKATASRPVDLAPAHIWLFVGIEAPIIGLVEHGLPVTDGNVDPQIVVLGACLEQQNLVAAVGAQTISEHATGRTRADNHVVELADLRRS